MLDGYQFLIDYNVKKSVLVFSLVINLTRTSYYRIKTRTLGSTLLFSHTRPHFAEIRCQKEDMPFIIRD